jgi:hypothetical protein
MAKKNMKMTSFQDKQSEKRPSKRKNFMRILTFIIALIVILGLVLIIPLEGLM